MPRQDRCQDCMAARFPHNSAISHARGVVMATGRSWRVRVLLFAMLSCIWFAAHAETPIKIGILATSASAPSYIAIERGYFAAEGLAADLVVFDAAQTIAVAAASRDIDFGTNGLTAALYTLASQGTLRIIGGQVHEAPGFRATALIASNAAWDGGLRSLKDLPGHVVAITQVGSAYQYILNLVAAKYGFDQKHLSLTAVQSLPNIATAVAGGRADAGVLNTAYTMPLLAQDKLKLLAWVGDDDAVLQIAGIWTSSKMIEERRGTVEAFLRAYKRGARDYHDAFTGPGETRQDQPGADAVYALLQKYLKQPLDQVKITIGYHDPEARLDVRDVERQIDWYKSQGMVKEGVAGPSVMDRRFVVPLP